VLACTVLAGCTTTADMPDEAITRGGADAPATATPEPTPSPAPERTPPATGGTLDPTPEAPTPRADRDCTDEQRTTLTATVDGQLDAITAREWEQALGFATDGFRADIGPDRFREIILEGFPVVADARARDIGRCRVEDDRATLAVTVEDRDGTRQPLLYLFARDGDGWAIDGAVPPSEGDGDSDDATTTA